MPNISDFFKSLLFTDDTTLTCMKDNEAPLRFKSDEDLDKFHKWTIANKLSVNQSKINCMFIPNRVCNSKFLIKLIDMALQFESST